MTFYLPIRYGVSLHVEVYAYLHDGQAAEGEARGVILEVNLTHGSFGRFIEFEFEEVDCFA